MQRYFYFFLLLSLMIPSSYCEVEEETTESATDKSSECDYNEELVDGNCVDSCYTKMICGNNTVCSTTGLSTYCYCMKGYTGNPKNSCWKMDEKSPCNPNLCGPNAECIADDKEIGPHCKCKKGFYDWPPNCRDGCATDYECGPTEICTRENLCENVCSPTTCGENSICRVDKKKLSINCSCKEGFIPEKNIGCRLKKSDDLDIPIDFISDVVNDKCNDECGHNAYCGPNDTCVCTQGYEGNVTHECKLIETPIIDPCNPNPCGGYSECKIVKNMAECSCIEGFGAPPYCSKCYSKTGCIEQELCVDGRCVPNVCENFCGKNADCKIFNGNLECSCKIQPGNKLNEPFKECITFHFISAAVIAALAG